MSTLCLRLKLRAFAGLALAGLLAFAPFDATVAQDVGPSGLPLPRFVSTRSAPINVRVGPGTKYDIAWIFKKAGLPVEIIQEYDTWRKIRYADGDEGWIHQSLLIGRRTALVQPFGGAEQAAVRVRAEDEAPLRAWLGTGFLVSVEACNNGWCKVTAETDAGRKVTGQMLEIELWGVYPSEEIE